MKGSFGCGFENSILETNSRWMYVFFLWSLLSAMAGRWRTNVKAFVLFQNTLDSLKRKSNVNVTSLSCLCYQRSKYIHSTYTTAYNFKIKFTYIFNMWFSTQNIASNVLISFPFVMKEELKSSLLESLNLIPTIYFVLNLKHKMLNHKETDLLKKRKNQSIYPVPAW